MKRPAPPAFAAIIAGQCGALPVAGYVRRSDEDQSAYSLEAQRDIVSRACAGWRLREPVIYADDDVSGGQWQRPAFDRLRADVAAGRVRIVVVPKVDRFARDVILCLQTVDAFTAAGAAVLSVFEPLDFASPFGRKALVDAANNAEWYRRNLATEVSKGLRAKAQRGIANGLPPFGYERRHEVNPRTGERIKGTDRLVPTEDADAVRLIYAEYASGDHSDMTLAALLTARGILHLDPGDGVRRPFTRDTVRKVLSNPTYAGWVTHGGERYDGAHEPLVSRETWAQCQAIRASRAVSRNGHVNAHREGGLLSGLARCARCGAPMLSWQSGGLGRVYYCKARRQRGVSACDAPLVQEGAAEGAVRRFLGLLSLPDTLAARVVAEAAQMVEQPAAPAMPDTRAALAALKARFLADELTAAQYEAERAALQAQPAPPAPPRLALDVADAARRLRDLPALFDTADLAERRALLRAMLASVELDKAGGLVAITPAWGYGPLMRACAVFSATLIGLEGAADTIFPVVRDAA